MSPPQPQPFDPADLPTLALATMKRAKFPMLATVDGDQPRVRPVSPVRTRGFVVHVANLRRYAKTAQLAANPKAELCYTDDDHHQVRITSKAVIETDPDILREIWDSNPLLRAYLHTPDHPELLVYRFEPQEVRYMKEWALEYHPVAIS
jgi:uncharacterized pyridoxamine 5'-phosphate oxidase family protein